MSKDSFFDLVYTYDAWKQSTGIVDVLQMNVANMKDLEFTTWLSKFGGSGFPSMSNTSRNISNVAVDTLFAAKVKSQAVILGQIFVKDQISKLASPLSPIGPEPVLPKRYVQSMRSSYVSLYCAWYKIISDRVALIDSTTIYTAYFPKKSNDIVYSNADALVDIIDASNRFDASLSFDDWLDGIYDIIMADPRNTLILDVYNQQLFAACLKPLFMFQYITKFIADVDITPANKAPRNLQTRRYAILAVYMFIFHTVFSTYKLSSSSNPFGKDANDLSSVLDNITNLFETEKKAIRMKEQLLVMSEDGDRLMQLSVKLQNMNKDINLSMINETTIDQIESAFEEDLLFTSRVKWLWIAAIIVTILLHMFCLVTNRSNISLILSASWIVVLSIVVLFDIVQK